MHSVNAIVFILLNKNFTISQDNQKIFMYKHHFDAEIDKQGKLQTGYPNAVSSIKQ